MVSSDHTEFSSARLPIFLIDMGSIYKQGVHEIPDKALSHHYKRNNLSVEKYQSE